MSSMGNRKRSKSRSRSRSRDKKEKYRKDSKDDYRDKSYNKNKPRKNSDDSVKLYLSNLGSNVSEKKVLDEFKYYGEVLDYSIKRKNGRSNYFGYLIMKNKIQAEKAMREINKSLGWKVSLYDKDDKKERRRSRSRSRSSRSVSKSEVNENNEENKQSTNNTNNVVKMDELKPIRVREIWVGNLPNTINEQSLYNQFFIFGEIAKMDCHFHGEKKFAFIKYKLSASASRAYEKAKNMNLNGSIIRVSFSDSGKRRDIIGDEHGYEVNEKTCKMLHLSLNKGSPVSPENVLRDLFKTYGTVKGLHIKNSPGFRPAIYLEYSKPEEAENALNNLTTLDVNNEKKKLIGDPMCDINYYFKKKIIQMNNMMNNNNMFDPNRNMQINMNPNMKMMYPYMMNPQMRYMMQRQMMQYNNPNNPINTGSNDSTSVNNTNPNSTLNTNQPIQQNNPNFSFPNQIPPMMNRFPFPMQNNINRMMYPNQMFNPSMMNYPNQQPPPQTDQNVKDLIQNALNIMKSQNTSNTSINQEEIEDQDISSIRDDSPNVFEKEYSLEEENLKNIWGGFLTKNKKDRVCVDAYQIRNECSEFLNNEYNLNVSHRTQFEDIVKRPIIGIIAFSPQNATQCDIFQDYINYFNEKNRVGVINLKNLMILYLVPPSEFSRKFYQNPKKHLLGIFVNSTIEPKSYVDMNNLSLPPPVISMTEKRLLLKNKNKVTAPTTVQSTQNVINTPQSDLLGELSKLLGNLEQDKIDLLIKAATEINNPNTNSGINTNTSDNASNLTQSDLNLLLTNPQFKNLLSQFK